MNHPYYIGMDLNQKTSTFSVKDTEGAVVAAQTVPTTKETIEKFLSSYRGAALAVEPVSQWYCYADFIESLGTEVKIANPNRAEARARLERRSQVAHVARAAARTGQEQDTCASVETRHTQSVHTVHEERAALARCPELPGNNGSRPCHIPRDAGAPRSAGQRGGETHDREQQAS